jgi:hypothetical protein
MNNKQLMMILLLGLGVNTANASEEDKSLKRKAESALSDADSSSEDDTTVYERLVRGGGHADLRPAPGYEAYVGFDGFVDLTANVPENKISVLQAAAAPSQGEIETVDLVLDLMKKPVAEQQAYLESLKEAYIRAIKKS